MVAGEILVKKKKKKGEKGENQKLATCGGEREKGTVQKFGHSPDL